jgi:hypothetical protein
MHEANVIEADNVCVPYSFQTSCFVLTTRLGWMRLAFSLLNLMRTPPRWPVIQHEAFLVLNEPVKILLALHLVGQKGKGRA